MGNSEFLKKLYLFKDLSDKELTLIEKATAKKNYGPGEEIFLQGERAKALLIVISGSIKIYQQADDGESVEITRLTTGSHFGEMSFLDGEPRSASAAALEATVLLSVDYDKLSEIMIEHRGISVHFYRQFALFLCGRLRATTHDLSFSRSKILSHF